MACSCSAILLCFFPSSQYNVEMEECEGGDTSEDHVTSTTDHVMPTMAEDGGELKPGVKVCIIHITCTCIGLIPTSTQALYIFSRTALHALVEGVQLRNQGKGCVEL